MRYCPTCSAEYQDDISECADCPGSALVSAEEMRARGRPLPGEFDESRLVRVDTADDPLTAEQLVGALEAAGIPVLARPGRGGPVGAATTGVDHAWWELLTPEPRAAEAAALLAQERRRLEAQADEAARAAEAEALEPPA